MIKVSIAENLEEVEKRISAAAKRSGRKREDTTLAAVTNAIPDADQQRCNPDVSLFVIPNILTCSHHTIFSTYACLFYFTCNYSESTYKIQSLVIISESSFRNSSYTSLYLCFHSIF